ncbi:MAG: hypothetical protein IMHGJWDQ_000684 [Candidatus Fervidibacter sp.]
MQHQLFPCPLLWHLNEFAEPNGTVNVQCGRATLPNLWQVDCFPITVIKFGLRPTQCLPPIARVFQDGFFSPFCQSPLVLLLQFRKGFGCRHAVDNWRKFRVTFKGFSVRPRFCGRAAPIGSDQANGHIQPLVNFSPEKVAHCRKLANGGGTTYFPPTFTIAQWSQGEIFLHDEEADLREVRRSDFLWRILSGSNWPLHVGLTRANPYLAK